MLTTEKTVDEKIELSQLESKIETGLTGFWEAGQALSIIQQKKLYSQETFEGYCRERWGISPQYANRLKSAFAIVEDLRATFATETIVSVPLPQTESQTRPLARLAPEQRAEAWGAAVMVSEKAVPTAREVSQVVNAVTSKSGEEDLLKVGDTVTKKGSDEPFRVTELDSKRPLVHCQDADGNSRSFLTTQLTGGEPVAPVIVSKPALKKPITNHLEIAEAELQIESKRLQIVEAAAKSLAEAVTKLLPLVPQNTTVKADVEAALHKVKRLLGLS